MAKKKLFYVILNSTSNPDRAAIPLVLAATALDDGHDVIVWMASEGALLSKNGNAEKMSSPIFGNIGELLQKVIQLGGEIGVCGTCLGFYKIDEKDLADGISKRTAAWAVQVSIDRASMVF